MFIQAQIKENIRVTGLCEGNSPVTGEFPAQRAGNAEHISILWRHHELGGRLGPQCRPHTQTQERRRFAFIQYIRINHYDELEEFKFWNDVYIGWLKTTSLCAYDVAGWLAVSAEGSTNMFGVG